MSEFLERVARIEQDTEQRAALYSVGSQVVMAGPGSGKTYLLTTKLAKVLLEATVKFPQKIACVTFSRRLAINLTHNLETLGVYDPTRLYVGTIHGFCISEIITPVAHLLPSSKLPLLLRIASDEESYKAIDSALAQQEKKLVSVSKQRAIKNYLDNFRKLNYDPTSDRFTSSTYFIEEFNTKDFASLDWSRFATDYATALANTATPAVDFVQIEMLALWIVLNYPSLALTLTATYPWLFIDEYQDLSPLFHLIVTHLLTSQPITIFAIGDCNQCIYEELQGSRPHFLTELAQQIEQISGNTLITLQTNYRSAQIIVDIGNIVLRKNTEYRASLGDTGVCHVVLIEQDQPTEPVKKILRKLMDDTVQADLVVGQIAVLCNSRSSLERLWYDIERSTSRPIAIDQHPEYPQKTELTTWLAELGSWCVGNKSYFHQLIPFWLQLNRLASGYFDQHQQANLEQQLFSVLFRLRDENLPFVNWLNTLVQNLKLAPLLESYRKFRPDHIAEWNKIYEHANGSTHHNLSLQQFSQLDAKVFFTTLHSSKGLEFDAAILVGLDGIKDSSSFAELKTRLAYVAVTRAKTRLFILLTQQNALITQTLTQLSLERLTQWRYRDGKFIRL